MVTKQEIIRQINREDERQGLFYKAGNPRYKMEYHYGKLDKYNKARLSQMLQRLKDTAETPSDEIKWVERKLKKMAGF